MRKGSESKEFIWLVHLLSNTNTLLIFFLFAFAFLEYTYSICVPRFRIN